jgi:putative PIN family toxin of toxin-antitoxin system
VTRVVVDPGVLISALIGRRGAAPDLLLRAWIDDRIDLVVSPALLSELERVIGRPKFAARIGARVAGEFVERVARHATVVDDPPAIPPVTRDPDDDYLVALVRHARVDATVSGDADPLEAGLSDPPVWTPRQLLDRIAQSP